MKKLLVFIVAAFVLSKSTDSGNIRAITTYGTKRINAYHKFQRTDNPMGGMKG